MRLCSLVLLGSVLAGQTTTGKTERDLFIETHDFLTRDGGRWRSPNADFKPGGAQPKYFGLEFRWVAGKAAVHSRILGVREDGSLVEYWAMFDAWDPGKAKGVHIQVNAAGSYLDGEFEILRPDFNQVLLAGRNSDGSKFVLRERMTLRGERGMETSSEFRVGEKWQPPTGSKWRRVKDFGEPEPL